MKQPQDRLLVQYGYVIHFEDSRSGYLHKINDIKKIRFTILNNHLLSDPPAKQLSRRLRHFIEKSAAEIK